MSKIAYLVVLQGQGDEYGMVVDQACWDWVHSPAPRFTKSGVYDPGTPACVREVALRSRKRYAGRDDKDMPAEYHEGLVMVTSGSWENDRALALADACLFTTMEGYGEGEEEAREWAQKNGYEIQSTYQGYIY